MLMQRCDRGKQRRELRWFGTLVRPARCASRTAPNTRSAPAATPAVLRTRFVTMNTYRVRGASGRSGTISSTLSPLPAAVETRTV